MFLSITVYAIDLASEKKYFNQFALVLKQLNLTEQFSLELYSQKLFFGDISLVDASSAEFFLDKIAEEKNVKNILLILEENSEYEELSLNFLNEKKISDLIVYPFRPVEVLRKLQYFKFNISFTNTLASLKKDMHLISQLHKKKAPKRFSKIKNLEISTRYIAGLASGADYFDVLEFRDQESVQQAVSFIFAHSSCHLLSSEFLHILENLKSLNSEQFIKELTQELSYLLKAKKNDEDQFSLFFCTFFPFAFQMSYVHFGGSFILFSPFYETPFKDLSRKLPPLSKSVISSFSNSNFSQALSNRLELPRGSRLAIFSNGFTELYGKKNLVSKLNQMRNQDGLDILNHFTFDIKQKFFHNENQLFPLDCTGVIIDLRSGFLSLI